MGFVLNQAMRGSKCALMHVLIVEPSESVAASLTLMLQECGYTYAVATTGEDAWHRIRTEHFDVIISEWEFTGMSGPQLCRYVRETDADGYTYFILCSRKTSTQHVVGGIEAGADDYIIKPFKLEEVEARLQAGRRILELERSLTAANKKLRRGLDQAAISLHSMLPAKRKDAELKVDWLFRPCSIIGGDFFKVFSIDESHLGVYAIDVAGHGVASSLFAVTLANMLMPRRTADHYNGTKQVNSWSCSPKKVATTLNERFPIDEHNIYATLFYGVVDRRTLTMKWVRAGYPPPILCSKLQTVFLNEGDPPIGMFEEFEYTEYETQLSPQDRLCVYSDGIIEMTRFNSGQAFGLHRLNKEISKRVCTDFGSFIQEIDSAILSYRGIDEFDDDLSFLAIEIGESAFSKAV